MPTSASDSGGGKNARLMILQLMIARSTSSFFGTWKTDAHVLSLRRPLFFAERIVALSRSTTVSLAFPVDRRGGLTEGAPSSPSSNLFFGKPSPPSS